VDKEEKRVGKNELSSFLFSLLFSIWNLIGVAKKLISIKIRSLLKNLLLALYN